MDYNGGERSKVFRNNIKSFCAMFSFTSTGGEIHRDLNDGGGPYTFCLNGHNHHRIGTLLPMHEDGRPRFAQLYIFDTENEVENRLFALNRTGSSNGDDATLRMLLQELITMLDAVNPLVQSFRMAKDRFRDSPMERVTLRLIDTQQRDGRQYNLPTASEVAALIPGDGNPTDSRDVIVEERGGVPGRYPIKRITELHPSFMALQYPLLFPYGEDGYRLYIPLNVPANAKRKWMSLREYYCFRLQERIREGKTLHKAGRLFHTYIVDAYTSVLDHDLDWYKRNQDTIRSELYNGLHDHVANGETDADAIGRRIILPSSFNGGPRHMIQQYQDAMAICRSIGTPDLFVTMTCNPRWDEIARHVQNSIPGQPSVDRPEIITRMFKIKLDELMEDIHKKTSFWTCGSKYYIHNFKGRNGGNLFRFVAHGSSIHAKVPLNLRNKYKNLVKEGCIYKIHKFKVLAYSTFYRPLKREFYVEFFASTFVQLSTIGQQLFPRYVFEFVQFDQLDDHIDNDTYLTDVIGVLREWGPLDNKDGSESRNRKLRNIVIVDTGDVKLNISLWGESALKYPDDLIESKNDTNIVVVLTGCRVRKFGGLPQLTTTVASQFHLNPRIIQVATYSQRPIHPVVFTSTDPECEELTITSIPDIYTRMVDGVDVGTRFVIEAIVIGVNLSKDWKYIQCTKCLRTVEFRDVRY